MSKFVNGEVAPLSEWDVNDCAQRMAAAESNYPSDLQAQIVAETEARLNAFAATRGYDSILSACTYAASTVPQFAAEAQYCVALRDQTWAMLYQMLAEVQAGTRPIPSGFDVIAPELPVTSAAWPG